MLGWPEEDAKKSPPVFSACRPTFGGTVPLRCSLRFSRSFFFLSFPFLSSSLYSFWILCLPNLTYSPLLAVSSLSLSLTRMLPRACHVRECACVRLAVSLSPASEGDGTGGDCTFLLMLPGAPSWFRLPTNPFPIHTCVTVIC